MGRARDLANILSSNTALATDAEVAATYQTKATAGLTLITTTTSFSGVSSVDLTSVFSATYKRYLILLKTTAATTYSLNARLLSASTPNTASNYYRSRLRLLNATTSGSTETDNTEWTLCNSGQTETFTKINIFYPFEAQNTYLENWTRFTGAAVANTGFDLSAQLHTVASSFDGIRFYSSSPNFSGGEVSVYGYAN
jgi:hypothetical protein